MPRPSICDIRTKIGRHSGLESGHGFSIANYMDYAWTMHLQWISNNELIALALKHKGLITSPVRAILRRLR